MNYPIPIRTLSGYDQSGLPIFDRIPFVLYHRLTRNMTYISPTAWNVYRSLNRGKTISKTAKSLKIPKEDIKRIKTQLLREQLIGKKERKPKKISVPITQGTVYIQLTEGCNLSCPGCATAADIIPLRSARFLTIDQLRDFLAAMFRSSVEKGIDTIKIKYAGGEPTIGKAFLLIEGAQKILQNLRIKFPSIKSIEQVVLTNGIALSDRQIEYMKHHNMRIAVSLWGLGIVQTQSRSPNGTFDAFTPVVSSIRSLALNNIDYNVSVVLTPTNADGFGDMLDFLWNTKSDKFIFHGIPELSDKPVPMVFGIFRPQSKTQLEIMKNGGYAKVLKGIRLGFDAAIHMLHNGVPLKPWVALDYLRLDGARPSTCGSGLTYIAVGPNGMSECHEALYSTIRGWDMIRSGKNLYDVARSRFEDPDVLLGMNIRYPNATLRSFMQSGVSGCPRLAKLEYGEYGHVSAMATEIYEKLLEEFLSVAAITQLEASRRSDGALKHHDN